MSVRDCILVALAAALAGGAAEGREPDESETIKSLERRHVPLRSGEVIVNGADLARNNYREFLELVVNDPELRAEALRRLGDLELEATEAEQLEANLESLSGTSYDNAVALFEQLLESYPDYERNDMVMYQLARAYEVGARNEEALATLNELVQKYPDTPFIDEVQFRRGEMLFLQKDYTGAKEAYSAVIAAGPDSRFYEQGLYKLGWSQFKLAEHEDSLTPFFELLDRKLAGVELDTGDEAFAGLSRPEQEMVEDTFRVLSISFSYMDGAESIEEFMAAHGERDYAYVVYMKLGDLYLDKERYVDAAETYGAFVAANPHHPKAPLLQVEVMEAYKLGGFPTLVLDSKKEFVELYATDGGYWTDNAEVENAEVSEHLKANLTDLAQYYHAAGQADGSPEDFRQAATWYKEYMVTFPEDPDTANTNFLLAETLFESGDYAQAAAEYERTSYAYPPHEHSAEAGYAALLAFQRQEERLEGEERVTWHQAWLDSGLRFADTYPDHPESGAVLTTVAEDLFRQEQFDLAIGVAQAVIEKEPAVAPEHARTAWTVIAHSQFDIENFAAAEQAYYQLRNFTPEDDVAAHDEIDERIASSIYKQGELARDAGDLETAVAHFTRLGTAVPDSDIRATADYDAAAALINLEAWDRAATVLEQFRLDYPDSEFVDDVSQKLAVTYLESGRGADAAKEFERIAAAPETSEDIRREALWKAAELYEEAGALRDERRLLVDIVARYPDPLAESIEARYRLLEIADAIGDEHERSERLQELVAADAGAGAQRTDRTRYLAAIASVRLAEPVRERFEAVRLTQPLDASVKVKRQHMEEVIEVYSTAADYGVAEVTTEATFRLAEVYEHFAKALMESERPADLDALALDQYELLLEEQVFPFEEQAIDLYVTNTERAAKGVYDEWVQKSYDRLAGLMPARYAKSERSEDVVTSFY
ncbi:MAG TPA: tetratricopeptide repeat protein [Woeseiaceae bacterium]|nr:tetratricopeptide repeat protein [Woeseiaceae bacterium]